MGWLQLYLDMAGDALGALVYVAMCAGAVFFQYYEYRRLWNHSHAAWWALKLVTPAAVGLIVLLALTVFDIDGLEGLAVFYIGLLVALFLGPFLIAQVARLLGVPPRDSVGVSGSLLLTLMVLWFAGSGAGNSIANMGRGNHEGRAEYLAYRHAAENAPAAQGEVTFAGSDTWLLPDGTRLAHLAFAIAPGYGLHTTDVRTLRTHGGGNSKSFSGTLGTCVTTGTYHILTVLNESEHFDVRLRFHAGNPDSMVEFRGDYAFPLSDKIRLRPLVLNYDGSELETPVPLPGYFLTLQFEDGTELKASDLLPEQTERIVGMTPGSRCLSGSLPGVYTLAQVRATLYSEEEYRKRYFELPLRRP